MTMSSRESEDQDRASRRRGGTPNLASSDPYAVLGLVRGASSREIKRAYFALVREFPPEEHADTFKIIRAAYEQLRTTEAKDETDLFLFQPPAPWEPRKRKPRLDLRQIISDPGLLAGVAEAYELMLRPLEFDRIAAIPVAAVPLAAAASLRLGKPFIYPRITAKKHGTGNAIEGFYQSGERVVLLDDVISSAQSKIEAVAILEAAGLKVTDLVVLVDRESGGRQEIERRGIRFHAFAGISELLELARSRGLGQKDRRQEVRA